MCLLRIHGCGFSGQNCRAVKSTPRSSVTNQVIQWLSGPGRGARGFVGGCISPQQRSMIASSPIPIANQVKARATSKQRLVAIAGVSPSWMPPAWRNCAITCSMATLLLPTGNNCSFSARRKLLKFLPTGLLQFAQDCEQIALGLVDLPRLDPDAVLR